jgi:predicted RNase H-like HicB family nuclease
MNIPVMIQPIAGKGFLAQASSPFDWKAEGATEEEALKNLQAVAMKCIAGRCKIGSITVPDWNDPLAKARANGALIEPPQGEHPLLKWAGTLDLNDPLVQEWQKAVEEYRREIDADPMR